MLQNAYFLAKIDVDTAENERNFADILPKNWQLLAAAVAALAFFGNLLPLRNPTALDP